MAKKQTKKGLAERRKTPRSTRQKNASSTAVSKKSATPARAPKAGLSALIDECVHCGTHLKKDDRALFVEEEIARTFCSEECIAEYFASDIKKLEKEYLTLRPKNDLSPDQREKLAHLRWVTLEDPDEVWRERTVAGDSRYTLISQFEPGPKEKIYLVCICLMLRGEPSFLFLAFPTQSVSLVQHFRKGEKMKHAPDLQKRKKSLEKAERALDEASVKEKGEVLIDGLAESWTPEENLRAQSSHRRSMDDIPASEFELYQACLEETLEQPNEVWAQNVTEDGRIISGAEASLEENDALETNKVYTFIRRYEQETPGMWYIVLAKETETEDQIELLDAFPTRDETLVERYRVGSMEVGATEKEETSARVVH